MTKTSFDNKKNNKAKAPVASRDTSNIMINNRPVRLAAQQGIERRREDDAKNHKLDRKLERNMGSSSGYYQNTKSGGRRKEFYGY